MPSSIVEGWAEWIAAVRSGERRVPDDVARASLLRDVDARGCAALGLRAPMLDRLLHDLADPTLEGRRAVRLRSPGGAIARLDALDLAVILTAAVHSTDFDDSHLASLTHPTAAPWGAALAAGALFGSSADDVATAVLIGREITIRIGLAADGGLGGRGLNTSCIAGTIGSAAAVAFLDAGRDAAAITAALSVAAGVAAGTQAWSSTGAANKWLQLGFASSTGMRAVLSTPRGFPAAADAIEGAHGLLSALVPEPVDPTPLDDRLGELWHSPGVRLKPYPFCHGSHALLDAINGLPRLAGLPLDSVASVTCEVSTYTEGLMCTPWEAKREPPSDYALKFALPAVIALALDHRSRAGAPFTGADVGVADLAPLRPLIERIDYRVALDDDGHPRRKSAPGVITIALADGTTIAGSGTEHRVEGFLGTGMECAAIRRKFLGNVGEAESVQSSEDEWRSEGAAAASWHRILAATVAETGLVDLGIVSRA